MHGPLTQVGGMLARQMEGLGDHTFTQVKGLPIKEVDLSETLNAFYDECGRRIYDCWRGKGTPQRQYNRKCPGERPIFNECMGTGLTPVIR